MSVHFPSIDSKDFESVARLMQPGKMALSEIAIVRALPGLGDFLCIIPAIRALRQNFPQARITLAGLPQMRSWVDRFRDYMDELVELPGYPGLPERSCDPEQLALVLEEMRSRRFDLALQFHGSGVVSNSLALELGATRTAGFFLPSHTCPDETSFLPYPDEDSEIERYLKLLNFLGIPAIDTQLEFPLLPQDWDELRSIDELHDRKYVCLHAGASVVARCWDSSRFAAVGDAIAQQGYQVVLTGSAAERDLARSITDQMQNPAINLAGRTSLGALAALLSRADLLVCNDTGVSHLGAAARVPSVVIFSASDPARWRPLDHQRHRALFGSVGVSVVDVIAQAMDVLEANHAA